MAGIFVSPTITNMGGGIDLTKYRLKVIDGASITGKGLFIGFYTENNTQKDFTFTIDNQQIGQYKTNKSTDNAAYYTFTIGVFVGVKDIDRLINTGLDIGYGKYNNSLSMLFPLPYKQNVNFGINGKITVLEYVG